MCCGDQCEVDVSQMWERIRELLRPMGVDLDCCPPENSAQIKLVCVAPDLRGSVEQLSRTTRDQVVMVRVDAQTARELDAWVESGAVRSRSEAAAVFIREGLKVRSAELAALRDALDDVERAKARLRDRAREVFGARPVQD